jgi:hypothetical protein
VRAVGGEQIAPTVCFEGGLGLACGHVGVDVWE